MKQSTTIALEEYDRLKKVERTYKLLITKKAIVRSKFGENLEVIGKNNIVNYIRDNTGNISDLLKKIDELEAKVEKNTADHYFDKYKVDFDKDKLKSAKDDLQRERGYHKECIARRDELEVLYLDAKSELRRVKQFGYIEFRYWKRNR
tara:strand:- start:1835 stop:2278 length:444 start_codon:yes stop_codon:yes gene_type:complete